MPSQTFIMTDRDRMVLETMAGRLAGLDEALRTRLLGKVASATIVSRDDVPEDVATLGSRISFRIDLDGPDSRILSEHRGLSPAGLYLPVTTIRGLALLGLRDGQETWVVLPDGRFQHLLLDGVQYQPEAAGRQRERNRRLATPAERRSQLRVVAGTALPVRSEPVPTLRFGDGQDDPGPSAA